MKKLAAFIVLSLLVHLSSYEGLDVLASKFGAPTLVNDLTQIDLVEEKPEDPVDKDILERSKDRPVVKQLDPNNPIDSRQDARFESEKDQRVVQETKAREFGQMQNSDPKKTGDQATSKPQPNSQKSATSQLEKNDPKLFPEGSELPEFARYIQSTSGSSDPSKVSLDLPSDIEFSETTNLNTDANIYYSFYNRVEELIRVRWEERLRLYWNRLAFEFKRDRLAGHVWPTTIEVVLKENGEYESATILQSSNYRPFDEAAVFAFRDAKYFPNVPKAKVEPDGRVRLKYRFNVHVAPFR